MITVVQLGGSAPLFVFNLYGWPSSHTRQDLRAKTEALAQATLQEAESLKGAPFLICGDFNAELSDLPSFQLQIAEGTLVDVAAERHLNGGLPPLRTCMAHGAKGLTRRDYVLASR
eukprot:1163261-Alexandrium_andersonii.AAC.1